MTMTDERMALLELVEQQADGDLVREMLAFAASRITEAEVEAQTGAAKGVRSPLREVQRNGYRDRDWDTPAGRISLEIPKLRKGSYQGAGHNPPAGITSLNASNRNFAPGRPVLLRTHNYPS